MGPIDCPSPCPCLLKVVGKDYPVPVKSIDVQLTVRGFVGNVVTTLLYKNTEQNPIEAVFEFPIDDQSAVYQFEAKIEDRVIIAECQEKKQAKQTYDDAVYSGQTAMLLKEDDASGDIFRCLVGNLPPGTEAAIKFAYVIELQLTPEGAVTLVLPTQLNPRYNPSESAGGTANPVNVSYVAPGCDQPYAFTFRADIFHSGKISSVKATSDKDSVVVKPSENGCQAQVELSKFVADHDFCLEIKYEEPYEPHVIIEKANTLKDGILCQDVMMLNFFPQLSESEFSNNHEFIIVIDRSGSMMGDRIEAAKAALLVFLKSLPPGCYFNIVGFGSSFALLFPDGSREYSEDSLKLACDYQADLIASFHGTEILRPLQAIYSKPPVTTHSRQILLLTDGEVHNTREVIDLVRKNAGNTRLFSLGIGEGASTSLVKGIARAGRGTAEFVAEESQITSVVMKTLKAAMQTSVTDLQLEWRLSGNDKLVQVPSEMPPVFSGDRLIIYAINAGQQSVSDGMILLKGKAGEHSVEFTITVDSTHNLSPVDAALPIHRLAAKAQIKQLEDGEKESEEKNKAEILLLSVAANIVSRHTSMVGVDKDRKDKVEGEMIHREVPLMMSRQSAYTSFMQHFTDAQDTVQCMPQSFACGSSSKYRLVGGGCRPSEVQSAGMPAEETLRKRKQREMLMMNQCVQTQLMCQSLQTTSYDIGFLSELVDGAEEGSLRNPDSEKSSSVYLSIISQQTFIGCWELNTELSNLLHVSLDQLQSSAPVKSHDVWATVLALSLLSLEYADKKAEWEMIEMKATQWLSSQQLEGHTVGELLQRARNVLQAAK